jgi:hypothetical protein
MSTLGPERGGDHFDLGVTTGADEGAGMAGRKASSGSLRGTP